MKFIRRSRAGAVLAAGLAVLPLGAEIVPRNAPVTPRDFYNEGTHRFKEGKLREAEASLQHAVTSNEESVQPVALYNLGHVRFKQGVEALKNSADGGATSKRGDRACALGDQAIQSADRALEGYDLDAIVAAYLKGRNVRKTLKQAQDAVKRALESYGAVLSRWQRASGDFKSAHELRASDSDARANAEIVDQHIAALIERMEAMQMMAQCVGDKRKDLKKRMDEMKKLVPKGQQQPGEGDEEEEDEEEEDEDQEKKQQPGMQEKENREGREMMMTWEEAARLLEALKLDANRKLPMGMNETTKPKDRKGKEW